MPPSKRVLFIVEADPAVGNLRRMMMSYLGWTVTTFATVGDCLRGVDRQLPNCIVSDLTLPAMNAIEMQVALRLRDIAVPVVAITDFLSPSLMVAAHAAGIAAVLDSPCDAAQLESAVQRVLAKPGPVPAMPLAMRPGAGPGEVAGARNRRGLQRDRL